MLAQQCLPGSVDRLINHLAANVVVVAPVIGRESRYGIMQQMQGGGGGMGGMGPFGD